MKKLILVTLFSTLMSASVFACTCTEPNFTAEDTNRAVDNFAQSRLGISSENMLEVQKISSKPFLTFRDRMLYAVSESTNGSNYALQCEMDCTASMNEKSEVKVIYYNIASGKNCERRIQVKMISNVVNGGFKTKIKTLSRAVCN